MADYDSDILEWSEHQAALLKRRAAGELVNESDLDWSNIAEEIESVGRSQLSAVKSNLVQALAHELKAHAWPQSRDGAHWQKEVRVFKDEAADTFTPSMRQRIDLTDLYRRALNRMPDEIDGQQPLPLPPPEQSIASLAEWLDEISASTNR